LINNFLLFYFTSDMMHFFCCKMIILMGYWWAITIFLVFCFLKGIKILNFPIFGHIAERYFPKEFIKKKTIKIRWKINSSCTNNRNIHFFTLGPLVWKWVGIQYTPNQHQLLFSAKDSKFRRIRLLEVKLSHGNHSCLLSRDWRQQRQRHNIICITKITQVTITWNM
jgi:hypothetical protein